MTTSTYEASGTVTDGTSGSPVAVDGEATITISADTLLIDLSSLEADPTAAGQEVSGIEITFASAVSGPSLTSSTGRLIDIGSGGSVTTASGPINHWGVAESGDSFFLATAGTGSVGGKPHDLIIGPANGSGLYPSANPSITGHLPSIQNTGTFDISFSSLPANEAISSVKIEFGTNPDGALTATQACFTNGTLIRTVSGDVAVEDLAIGDHVVTASGDARPIRWLGHRAIACARHPNPTAVWPICIRAGAFADAKPVRDLWVSPGHSILHEGVLIQAEKLVNGTTIVQVPRDQVEYWHVELDSHDIILAEGLPTESYLDTGNRTAFVNGGAFLDLHPDFRPKHWAETCMPLVIDGPEIRRARAALLARAKALGHEITAEADLHVIADGKRIEPVWPGKMRAAFILAAGSKSVALRSRSFIPAYVDPASTDTRELGVRVGCLQIDDSQISLEDDPALAEGWHHLERRPDGLRRWTTGYTPLPSGTRLIVIDLAGRGYYWEKQEASSMALVG